MKKILLAILVVICLGGVGFIGYMIFGSRNIASVEISGNIQTLYVVGDDLSFGDAKLKVTYRNGSMRLVDLDSESVSVAYFTTSVETHGTMEITYKSKVIKIDYNVIKKGYHYLTQKKLNSTTTGGPYTLSSTTEMLYVGDRGILRYYTKSGGNWYMHDGQYDYSYKYTIFGDTMTVALGSATQKLSVKADYSINGTMLLKSTVITRDSNDPDIVISKEEKTYQHYNTNEQLVNTVSVDYSKVNTTDYNGKKVLTFKVNDAIETSVNKNLLLKVRYIDQDPYFPIRVAYVYVCNEIIDDELRTGNVTNGGINTAYCFYESKEFYFYYNVVNA